MSAEASAKADRSRAPGDADEVRTAVASWVEDNWGPDLSLVEWRVRLFESGWACPTWPVEWGGRGLPAAMDDVVVEALFECGVPGPPESVGTRLAAPTLLEHGSDRLKSRLLRGSATGEIVWCQLFSEPGAGSDLAGLTARADLDADDWVVTGQKVWSTGAAQADVGLLLARSDWDAPKHRGITCLVLPMRQSGVEVRPLRQMNGHSSFNEVFLDRARVSGEDVIGEPGAGWKVALTTLAHERRLTATRRRQQPRDAEGRVWREASHEQATASKPHRWYPQRAGRVDLLIERARATGRADDPVVRQEIAKVLSLAWCGRWTAQRAATARRLGRRPGPEGSIGKLATSIISRSASGAHSLVAGAPGMLAGRDGPLEGLITEIFVSVPSQSIAGGTDEIQHNILAERVLGLPRDPSPERDLPFRQTMRNV
jgi:alkylation response protein AidB-like acyl-CoA dehydrogenase